MQKLKNNEFLLLKSKDDYSFEHYKTSPLSKMTGFIGTAGEGIGFFGAIKDYAVIDGLTVSGKIINNGGKIVCATTAG